MIVLAVARIFVRGVQYTYSMDDYFNNVVNNIEESARFNLRQLREPVDRNQWGFRNSLCPCFLQNVSRAIVVYCIVIQFCSVSNWSCSCSSSGGGGDGEGCSSSGSGGGGGGGSSNSCSSSEFS